jgi:hypothetical protein
MTNFHCHHLVPFLRQLANPNLVQQRLHTWHGEEFLLVAHVGDLKTIKLEYGYVLAKLVERHRIVLRHFVQIQNADSQVPEISLPQKGNDKIKPHFFAFNPEICG